MFDFDEKKSGNTRDDVIGLIASIIDQNLPEHGYEKFASGYISINEGLGGAGWSSKPIPIFTVFSFKVNDIKLHELLMDDVFGKLTDAEKTMTVDIYCSNVHKYLMENFKEYKTLDFLDPRLS